MTGRVLIVGAGAIGVTTALSVRRMGFDVTVVDSEEVAGAGCSHANAGLLAPSHAFPLTGMANVRLGLQNMLNPTGPFRLAPRRQNAGWIPRFLAASTPGRVRKATRTLRLLCAAGAAGHAALVHEGVPTSWVNSGMLDVFTDSENLALAQQSLRAHPLQPEYDALTQEQLSSRVPGLTGFSGGIFTPGDSYCDGGAYVAAIAAQAAREGVEFQFGTRVNRLALKAEAVRGVDTAAGRVAADHVIVAAGSATKHLVRPTGLNLPLTSAKGYVIDLATGPDDPTMPIGLKSQMMVVTPYSSKVRLAGVLELVGEDKHIDEKRTKAMIGSAVDALPQLAGREVLQVWSGMRPCSADGLPMIGRTHADGLSVATGHGQHGLILAPVTAQIIAAQLAGRPGTPAGVNPWQLSPVRFTSGRRPIIRAAAG